MCATCGTSIVWKNAQARYCSTRCRVTAHRNNGLRQLQQIPRWVTWELKTKRPLTADGKPASVTDPNTWAPFTHVNGKLTGFVLGDGIGCIDLDHCLIDGQPTPAAAQFLEQYPNHYIEISPSGDGLHIWGHLDEAPGTKRITNGLSIETYSAGRYITVTGRVYQPGQLLPL